jgi:hypothetical protein
VAEVPTAADLDGPLFVADGAELAAGRAGPGVTEALGLLGGGLLEGAGGQAAGGGDRDLFHGVQIDVEAGALVPEGVADNNLAPAVGQVVDFLEVLGGKLARRHGLNFLAVRANGEEAFAVVVIERQLGHAKRLLHSAHPANHLLTLEIAHPAATFGAV